jgi:hypothetical protein
VDLIVCFNEQLTKKFVKYIHEVCVSNYIFISNARRLFLACKNSCSENFDVNVKFIGFKNDI